MKIKNITFLIKNRIDFIQNKSNSMIFVIQIQILISFGSALYSVPQDIKGNTLKEVFGYSFECAVEPKPN